MKNIFCLLFPFLIVSCGLPKSHNDGPNPPPIAGCNRPDNTPTKATLVLFGAPPCSHCHETFPEITSRIEAAQTPGLKVKLYVETGAGWTEGPTPAISNAYAVSVHMCADEILSDSTDSHHHPSFAAYTQYTGVSIDEMTLPAAVVFDKNGVVVERYQAGIGFVPVSIVNRAIQEAKK